MRKLFLLLMLIPLMAFGQMDEKPLSDSAIVCCHLITHNTYKKAQLVSIGHTSQLDTYLSPEHYSGFEVRYIGEGTSQKEDSRLSHTWTSQGYIAETDPRSKNATYLSAFYELSFGMHYNFQINQDLQIAVGGQADALIGGIYNTRNGNNPAQLHTGIDIAPSVRVNYGFRLFRKYMRLNYEVSAPLLGLQFSPAYGQSYYEIFSRGNYDHNICFTSPFNAASISNLLTLDIPIKKGALRIGYLGDFRQSKLNDIKFHNFTHSFVIGYAY